MKHFSKILTGLILLATAFVGWEVSGRILTGKDDVNIIGVLVLGVLALATLSAYAAGYIERIFKDE